MQRPQTPDLPPGGLAAALLTASAWFDEALLARLAASGGPSLSPNRSRAFLAMSAGPIRVSDLARELDISRQAAHKLLDTLATDDLVERHTDEQDHRAHVVSLTGRGLAVARAAGAILRELEDELTERIGSQHVDALRAVLAQDWGPSPS
jgi:DNA-binding MarR family transcriptional regulator